MQHRSPRATAVGIDLGSANTDVSIRGRGERSSSRVLDGVPADAETSAGGFAAVFGRVRAFRDEFPPGPTATALAVPASWERDRAQEAADAAEAAGLGRPSFVPAPEAAVVYVEARGHELEPGAALVVYALGADACEVGVVRRDEDGHTVLAGRSLGGVGGDEFDDLVLAYLSGRHRDADPGFWDRVADPAEEALRPAMLAEIRRARERLSDRPSADIALREAGLELRLTQQELESCIGEVVEQTCDLTLAVLAASGIEPGEADGLLLVGGASRTPLAVARLAERTGLKPVLPDRPERVAAEGAALVAFAASAPVEPRPSRLRRNALRAGVLASLLLVAVAGTSAIFGSELGEGEREEIVGVEATSATAAPSATPSAPEGGVGSGGGEGPVPGEQQSTASEEAEESADAQDDPTPEEEAPTTTGSDREESAAVGTVPEVTGMSALEAQRLLTGTGFTAVTFEAEEDPLFGPWYDDCEVKAQDPEPGARHELDAPIAVTYSHSEAADCAV
ncbi:MAG TPA: Hsp70 family protein [Glycomyces sp.]|nr:Hsp70 family protein [Glycomyces sp.]